MPKKQAKPDREEVGGKGQFPTTAADEKRLAAYVAGEFMSRGVALSRAQAFAALFRRGLETVEKEAKTV